MVSMGSKGIGNDAEKEKISKIVVEAISKVAEKKGEDYYIDTDLIKIEKKAGGDVMGVDWKVRLDEAWERLGHDVAVQGNLDPTVLFAPPEVIKKKVKEVLDRAGGRPGHIFNLGHGIILGTPVESVKILLDAVHEYSRKG